MKPSLHPSLVRGIRKTIMWGGAAVTVLLVVVWVGSCFIHIGFLPPAKSLSKRVYGISCGCIYLNIVSSATSFYAGSAKLADGWHLEIEPRKPVWWFKYEVFSPARYISIPLWPFAVATAALTLTAWHRDTLARRRAKLNLCAKCGYDRAGLHDGASAKCPECGAMPVNS